MKKLTKIFAVLIIFIFVAGNISAQSSEHPLLVVSSNKVNMADIGKVNQAFDSLFAPILKELVDEGMIYSYGLFNHSWGDEWNVHTWYVAKDLTAFDKFWNEFTDRASKRHPGAFGKIVKYFQAHKDNIYTIRDQYPVPPSR